MYLPWGVFSFTYYKVPTYLSIRDCILSDHPAVWISSVQSYAKCSTVFLCLLCIEMYALIATLLPSSCGSFLASWLLWGHSLALQHHHHDRSLDTRCMLSVSIRVKRWVRICVRSVNSSRESDGSNVYLKCDSLWFVCMCNQSLCRCAYMCCFIADRASSLLCGLGLFPDSASVLSPSAVYISGRLLDFWTLTSLYPISSLRVDYFSRCVQSVCYVVSASVGCLANVVVYFTGELCYVLLLGLWGHVYIRFFRLSEPSHLLVLSPVYVRRPYTLILDMS